MKRYRGKENRITAVKREYDLVPRLPASRSSNDYSHPLSLLPHIATVADALACEQWRPRRYVRSTPATLKKQTLSGATITAA